MPLDRHGHVVLMGQQARARRPASPRPRPRRIAPKPPAARKTEPPRIPKFALRRVSSWLALGGVRMGGRGRSRVGKSSYGKSRFGGVGRAEQSGGKVRCFKTRGDCPHSAEGFLKPVLSVSHLLVLRFEERRQQAVDPQQSGPRQANRIVVDFQIAFGLILLARPRPNARRCRRRTCGGNNPRRACRS